jgi:hypothetical protein
MFHLRPLYNVYRAFGEEILGGGEFAGRAGKSAEFSLECCSFGRQTLNEHHVSPTMNPARPTPFGRDPQLLGLHGTDNGRATGWDLHETFDAGAYDER